jgi:hypothetical protein
VLSYSLLTCAELDVKTQYANHNHFMMFYLLIEQIPVSVVRESHSQACFVSFLLCLSCCMETCS